MWEYKYLAGAGKNNGLKRRRPESRDAMVKLFRCSWDEEILFSISLLTYLLIMENAVRGD